MSAPASEADGFSLAKKQELLDRAAAHVDEQAPGFAQIRINVPELRLAVYWKGQPPASVRRLQQSPPPGVSVEVIACDFSRRDIQAAEARIQAAARSGTLPTPDSMAASADYDGLEVGFAATRPADATSEVSRAKFQGVAKMRVAFVEAPPHGE
jgi:hypothetical protein